MATHVILGKGPVGGATAEQLVEMGHEVRVLSRSGAPEAHGGAPTAVRHVAVDAADPAALCDATGGADVIYNCANPPHYHRWREEWPPVATALLDAAEAHGSVLVTMSNLYGYGEVDGPITEDTPLDAISENGRIRAGMWAEALARHDDGRVRVTEARASDFFGPGVLDGGHLGSRVVPKVLSGKGVRLLGDPDLPHSWTYIPDVGRTLARLGTDPAAWGRAWHVPSPPPATQRQMVERLCDEAGVARVKVGRLPWSVVRAVGLVVPGMRALPQVRYQFDRPFVVDSDRASSELGLVPTPLDDAIAATVAWWRAGCPNQGAGADQRRSSGMGNTATSDPVRANDR